MEGVYVFETLFGGELLNQDQLCLYLATVLISVLQRNRTNRMCVCVCVHTRKCVHTCTHTHKEGDRERIILRNWPM